MTATEVDAWIDGEVDPADAEELRRLLRLARDGDADARRDLDDRFRAPLSFGTAGLRGPLRAGPNGMNAGVVRLAAAGLAAWLTAQGRRGRPVVVGYDARHGSARFARDTAEVLAAAGFDARLLREPTPTPLVAFAVRRLGAAAGVVVTASHNPPRDNGYKVYGEDGGQIVPPVDREIEACIRAAGPACDVPTDADGVSVLDDAMRDAYVRAVAGLAADGPRRLSIVHTALHGVGTDLLIRVFEAAGFPAPACVAEQRDPDPDFPTVMFPNPEEPGALDLALALAAVRGADLVIANDPDADRCAVAVPDAGGWRVLRGDELGVLLAEALMTRGTPGTYATTIVSSSMLRALCAARGVDYAETLTGFKWIVRAADATGSRLAFGYEEALGYAVAPDLVRDKDGISAALLVAETAARLAADGSSLPRRLDELAAQVGRHVTDQVSVRVEDLTLIDATMRRLRADPPRHLLGRPVEVDDLQPDADVLRLRFDGGRVVIRPSGTEPKLKAYLEVVEPSGTAAGAAERLAALRAEVTQLVG